MCVHGGGGGRQFFFLPSSLRLLYSTQTIIAITQLLHMVGRWEAVLLSSFLSSATVLDTDYNSHYTATTHGGAVGGRAKCWATCRYPNALCSISDSGPAVAIYCPLGPPDRIHDVF